MSKKQALILFSFFDILSLLVLWWGYVEMSRVFREIAALSDTVKVNNQAGIPLLGMIIPILHLFALYEYLFPTVLDRGKVYFNRSLVIFFIILLAGAFSISTLVKTRVEKSGYQHCRHTISSGTLFKTLLYTRTHEICDRIHVEGKRP